MKNHEELKKISSNVARKATENTSHIVRGLLKWQNTLKDVNPALSGAISISAEDAINFSIETNVLNYLIKEVGMSLEEAKELHEKYKMLSPLVEEFYTELEEFNKILKKNPPSEELKKHIEKQEELSQKISDIIQGLDKSLTLKH